MPKSIFLSYVYEDLRHRDDVIRWAKEGRLGGAEYVTVTEAEDVRPQGERAVEEHLKPRIRGAAVVLCLIGQNTHNHDWVRYELSVATSLNKRIVLARIPGTTGAAPEGFAHVRTIPLDPQSLANELAK